MVLFKCGAMSVYIFDACLNSVIKGDINELRFGQSNSSLECMRKHDQTIHQKVAVLNYAELDVALA